MNYFDFKRAALFFSMVITSIFAFADLQTEKLSFPTESSVTSAKPEKNLQKLKSEENKKQWSDCADLAKTQFETQKSLRPWIMLTWLHCARENFQNKKVIEKLQAPLTALEKSKELLLQSAAKNLLMNEVVKSHLALADVQIEQLKTKKKISSEERQAAWKNMDNLLSYGDRLEKETKAKIFFNFSELSQIQHNLKAAKQFLTQSLFEKESRIGREKLNSVTLALGEVEPLAEKKQTTTLISEHEQKMEDRLDVLSKEKDFVNYIDEGIQYLNRYPNGRSAKNIQERLLEVYSSMTDKVVNAKENSPDLEKFTVLRLKALELIEKVDSVRAHEWARSLHKRNDFEASLRLSERSLSNLMFSPNSASLLYIAGRSSQFLGQYKKAEKYFEQYLEHNSGAEDVPEVLFRLALVHFRLGQYPTAVSTFERLLQLPGNDRYELSSRYWLIRALQKQKNPRATQEIQIVTEKYPFSYYGIRLRAEQNGNQFEFSEKLKQSSKLSADFYQSSLQVETLNRVLLLAENGWLIEAQRELATLTIPNEAVLKSLLAQKFAKAKAFPVVIKLMNEAGDKNGALRATDLLTVSYPNEYQVEIEREAKRVMLSPILVKSLIRQESAFGIQALSTSNAIGLMQLIPPTAQEVAQELKLGKVEIPEDVYNPEINIQMGTYYIAKMIKQYGGSVPMGLAAYNAGPNRLKSFVQARPEVTQQLTVQTSEPEQEIWFDELPWNETSFYVKAILRNTLVYKTFEQKKISLDGVIWKDLSISPVAGGKF